MPTQMTLKNRIQDDVKDAMRARDRERLPVLRLITAAIKQKEVDDRVELDEAGVLGVLDKMAKQRRESLEQFEKAGRDDLAAQERYELEILKEYLPEQLGAEELYGLIGEAIAEAGAESMRDMGTVMGLLRPRVQGRADMKAVSEAVRTRLSG